jgi:4-deoxy-L-threo-5-hexosulose-uronate ketol-isomerase
MDGSMKEQSGSMRFLPGEKEAARMSTAELRDAFLVERLFVDGEITLQHIDLDRLVLGGAVPTTHPLKLEAPQSLGARFFTERREVALLNIGGAGTVRVGESDYKLAKHDLLYVGRGNQSITFASDDTGAPARFYIVSYPTQADYPTSLVRGTDVQGQTIGAGESANLRNISRYVHLDGARSGQLVIGVTRLAVGSVWNTMPAHTHHRRTEVYLYFDVPADGIVVHLMGTPSETRHLIVRDCEAVLSPAWSIHAGCGTSNYSFCWAMGGENQDYSDMQVVSPGELK